MYDIKKTNPYGGEEKGKGPSIEIEVGKPTEDLESDELSFDDEGEAGKEDPLAEFSDEDIIKSLEARPALIDILKESLMGEKKETEIPEEGIEGLEEDIGMPQEEELQL